MFQRKPILYKSSQDSLTQGYLESRILIWNALKKPGRRHPHFDFNKSNISQLSRQKLLNLRKSQEKNEAYRLSIHENELPDVKVWFALKERIESTFNVHDKIAILKEALAKRVKLSPLDTSLLLTIADRGNFNEILQFFFDSEFCTTQHLVAFYNRHLADLNLFKLCINHPKFPATHKNFIENGGTSIVNISRQFVNINTYFDVISFVITNHPQLISYFELKTLHQTLISRYETRKYLGHANDSLREFKNVIWLICHHPECSFLYSKYSIDELIHKKNNDANYPFFWAAKMGYQDIFNLYYFHADTIDYAREIAIKLAIKNGNESLVLNTVNELILLCHKQSALTFYLAISLQEYLVKDILKIIINLVFHSAEIECTTELTKKHKLPQAYAMKNHSLTLFQKNQLSLTELIDRMKTGVQNYISDNPCNQGKNLGWCIISLLNNTNLTSECKIFAAYSVLNKMFNVSKPLQFHVTQAVKDYTNGINQIAENYAVKSNIDLILFCQNFISMINKGNMDCHNCSLINENDLLVRVGVKALPLSGMVLTNRNR